MSEQNQNYSGGMSPHQALCSPEVNLAGTEEAGCTLVSSANATAINADDALQIRLAYRPPSWIRREVFHLLF